MRVALLVTISLLLGGCAEALYSRVAVQSHDAYSDADYAAFLAIRQLGATRKGEVLATLGPPIQVLGQDAGDVFVYQRRARNTSVVNINPAVVSGFGPTVPIPIYVRSATTGRDDTLMLFFDPEGRLQGESLLRGIEDPGAGFGAVE
jgi:hypothetical protein